MKAISLFSGIGGLDLAAESVGIEIISMVEIDDFCQKVLRNNFKSEIHSDITVFSGKKYNGEVNIVFGGFPCQPFSVAGMRKGESDDRYMWGEMLRVIQEIQPRWVVGENVKGLITSGIERIKSDLESEGYKVWIHVLSASSVGALHQRERVFIVGFNEGRQISNSTSDGRDGCEKSFWSSQIDARTEERQDKAECVERCSSLRSVLSFRDYQERWGTIPSILRISDGISRKLDKRRIKALGNAVVPQQALVIFNTIVNFEKELNSDSK